jgi:hypothetical protein
VHEGSRTKYKERYHIETRVRQDKKFLACVSVCAGVCAGAGAGVSAGVGAGEEEGTREREEDAKRAA